MSGFSGKMYRTRLVSKRFLNLVQKHSSSAIAIFYSMIIVTCHFAFLLVQCKFSCTMFALGIAIKTILKSFLRIV